MKNRISAWNTNSLSPVQWRMQVRFEQMPRSSSSPSSTTSVDSDTTGAALASEALLSFLALDILSHRNT